MKTIAEQLKGFKAIKESAIIKSVAFPLCRCGRILNDNGLCQVCDKKSIKPPEPKKYIIRKKE